MKEFDKLIDVVKILRSPKGCPWDRAQNIDNMKKYLLEEAYELIEAIDDKKTKIIKEELGDLFLILVIITQMLKEKGELKAEDVLESVNNKLISRHPHVFSSKKIKTKEEVLKFWVKEKAKHKKRKTIKERLPKSGPALLLAGIFFKEWSNIGNKCKDNELPQELISVGKRLKSLGKDKDQEDYLADVLFHVCQMAYVEGLDLEHIFRKNIFKRAENVLYKEDEKKNR